MVNHKPIVIVGIDLADSSCRPAGVYILRGMKAYTHLAFHDEKILCSIDQAHPDLVPIDAPLSLPNGRNTIHDRCGLSFQACPGIQFLSGFPLARE
jgi:predicted nuclease with RNAse H fold